MRWLPALSSVLLVHFALANPKPVAHAIMETEQVDVLIQGDMAIVKGKYLFRRVTFFERNPTGFSKVYFPLACARGTSPALADMKFSLSVDHRDGLAYTIATNAPIIVPPSDDYSLLWILTTVSESTVRSWDIEVSYRQPLIDGVFYYLPILGRAKPNQDAFQIRVKADRPIRWTGKKGGMIAKSPRELVFFPVDQVMISVAADPLPKNQNPGPSTELPPNTVYWFFPQASFASRTSSQ